jgi:hypothetical protein
MSKYEKLERDFFSLILNLDCPPCYREVQKRVNRYRRDLNLLHNAIATLNSSQTLNTLREDKKLTSELDALANHLNNLKTDLHSKDKNFSSNHKFCFI